MNIKIILSVFVENIIYSKLYRPKGRLNFPPKFVKKMYFYPDFRPHRPFSDLKGTHVRTRTHSPAYASSRAPSDAHAYAHVCHFLIFESDAHARRTTHAHFILPLCRSALLARILSVIMQQGIARALHMKKSHPSNLHFVRHLDSSDRTRTSKKSPFGLLNYMCVYTHTHPQSRIRGRFSATCWAALQDFL